ncbi:unnamed protein product, partial [Choristocarpus tenellus]
GKRILGYSLHAQGSMCCSRILAQNVTERQLALRPEGGIEVLRNALRCTPLIQYRW